VSVVTLRPRLNCDLASLYPLSNACLSSRKSGLVLLFANLLADRFALIIVFNADNLSSPTNPSAATLTSSRSPRVPDRIASS